MPVVKVAFLAEQLPLPETIAFFGGHVQKTVVVYVKQQQQDQTLWKQENGQNDHRHKNPPLLSGH